jgi:hypothetical protein
MPLGTRDTVPYRGASPKWLSIISGPTHIATDLPVTLTLTGTFSTGPSRMVTVALPSTIREALLVVA